LAFTALLKGVPTFPDEAGHMPGRYRCPFQPRCAVRRAHYGVSGDAVSSTTLASPSGHRGVSSRHSRARGCRGYCRRGIELKHTRRHLTCLSRHVRDGQRRAAQLVPDRCSNDRYWTRPRLLQSQLICRLAGVRRTRCARNELMLPTWSTAPVLRSRCSANGRACAAGAD
jgi:hypothetical protein